MIKLIFNIFLPQPLLEISNWEHPALLGPYISGMSRINEDNKDLHGLNRYRKKAQEKLSNFKLQC